MGEEEAIVANTVCSTCRVAFDSPKARANHERIHLTDVRTRLYARVDKNGPVPEHQPELGPCWVWTGHTGRDGYGRMSVDGRGELETHRIALSLALGRPISPGMLACHHCDNKVCLRPDHLFEATYLGNNRDRAAKGRSAVGERSGRARLTEAKVRHIRVRLAAGSRVASLARACGVSEGTIQAIAEGRTWQHVKEEIA